MKTAHFTFFLSFLFFSSFLSGQTLEDDRLALVALYNATGGASWTNNTGWIVPGTPGDDPCGWFGVGCSGGRVTHLDLTSNNLTGNIPTEIGYLSNLELLWLRFNNLTGSIPTEIGNLTKLTSLILSSNNLTGNIPTEIGYLSNLELLWLRFNNLTGSIPTEIGNLTDLTSLTLGSNNLGGNIPTEFGQLTKLTTLLLERSNLTGPIPNTLANLGDLVNVNLEGNDLTGPIPPWLGSFSNLQVLWIGGNQFLGPIPPQLGLLSNLEDLNLESNQLIGTIPSEIGDLTALKRLLLRGNNLSGNIPTEIGNLSNLEVLWLGENPFLAGQLPPELGMLSNLKRLHLSFCSLNGAIPMTLQNLSNLIELDLRNNMLDGTIPSGLANINSLEFLALEANQLSGPVPDFSTLPSMNNLWIRFNRFTFEGVEQNLGISDYLYNFQAPIPIFLIGNQLSVNASGNIANSTYKWYKVGIGLVATIVGDETYVPTISGDYYVQVTNTNIPNFTLASEITTVTCTTEVCDDIDNDCDGHIDEGFDQGLPCGWTLDPSGINCPNAEADYDPSTATFTLTSEGCYSPYHYRPTDPHAFIQIELCGEGEIIAHVIDVIGNGWAGISMRESTDPSAKMLQLMIDGSSLTRRELRQSTGGLAYAHLFQTLGKNWLRLTRSGNVFGAYHSLDGVNWVPVLITNIAMSDCIQIGMISMNSAPTGPVTGLFESVSINGGAVPLSTPPGVDIEQADYQSDQEMWIYPNPTREMAFVDLSDFIGEDVQLRLYRMTGQQVRTIRLDKVQKSFEQLDLNGFTDGSYLVELQSGVKRITQKLILVR